MALSSEKGGGPFVAFNAITACPLCTNLSINDETLAAFLGRSYTAPAGALVPSSRRISRSLAVASSRTATSAGSLPCRDAAPQAVDGYFRILPCVDDVINVTGHRLGTKALESACLTVEEVAAAAVP